MASSAAERQRRHRRHRRGDHSLCDPMYCRGHGGDASLPGRQPRRVPEGPQALYRFFGQDGELLYVGITVNLPERFRMHRGEKPWWTDVSRITVEHFPDRASVEQAEREAIAAENPRWNVVRYSTTPPVPTQPDRSAITVSYGGVDVRIESSAPAETLARTALEIASGLRRSDP